MGLFRGLALLGVSTWTCEINECQRGSFLRRSDRSPSRRARPCRRFCGASLLSLPQTMLQKRWASSSICCTLRSYYY